MSPAIGYTTPAEVERLRAGGTAVVQSEPSDFCTVAARLGEGDAIGSGVRALEWQHFDNGTAWARSETGLSYQVAADGWCLRNGPYNQTNGMLEAKAAAQADFERRVLSCLSPVAVEEADETEMLRQEIGRLTRVNASLINDTVQMGMARDDAIAERDELRRTIGSGVRALEWTNVGRCVGWISEDEHTHLYHAKGLDRLYEVARGKVGWWAKWQGGFHAKELPTLEEAKAAAQADFERAIMQDRADRASQEERARLRSS